jgi:hypothetical protein
MGKLFENRQLYIWIYKASSNSRQGVLCLAFKQGRSHGTHGLRSPPPLKQLARTREGTLRDAYGAVPAGVAAEGIVTSVLGACKKKQALSVLDFVSQSLGHSLTPFCRNPSSSHQAKRIRHSW